MSDSVNTISGLTGLPRSELLGIWAEVKANHARLDACPRHNFVQDKSGQMGSRWTCAACGGWVSASDALWYQRGLEHASV